MTSIGICHIHFRTTNLDHLDAAWFTLSKQDFEGVGCVIFVDNNTEDDPEKIQAVLNRYLLPVPLILDFQKHGKLNRTQSWSLNHAASLNPMEWMFLSRTDFLLNFDCLQRFRQDQQVRGCDFVTSYCHQMGYDAQLSNTDALAPYSLPDAPWRTNPDGPMSLVGKVPANYFHDTDIDAGVWLTRTRYFAETGGLDERMVSWGYQQQAWQRKLRSRGVKIHAIPDYLFHHQHHWAPRDTRRAFEEARFEHMPR